jgi:hypothetical protein
LFAELRRRTVVAVGSEGLVDRVDELAGPAGPLGGDPNQRPPVSGEIFLPINVTVPLVAVGPVLITLVLDDHHVRHLDQIDPADRALVIADDQMAFRHRQPGKNQAETQPGLPRGVHPFPHQTHRGTGEHDAAT